MIYTVTLNPALDRELTVPALTFNAVLRADAARIDVGGKGFNVSRVLAALGGESVALGFAGGRAGEMLRDGLTALGIATNFVPIANETRTNVSIVAADHDRHVKVNEPGPTISAAEQAQLRAIVRELAKANDWWVLAGSVPPGVAPTIYADLIRDLKSAGARVVLDTSGAALQHAVAAPPFLIKPNREEIGALTNMPVDAIDDAIDAARSVRDIPVVVVSLGKAGAVALRDGHGWIATPPVIKERNPIGAGDAMVAGLVWALSRAYPLPEALRWGVACGAATAGLPGTAVGSYADVERLLAAISVREVT